MMSSQKFWLGVGAIVGALCLLAVTFYAAVVVWMSYHQPEIGGLPPAPWF